MIAETIFVGTELLLGQIVNTNAAYLGKQLSMLGIDSYYQTVVGDNPRRLQAGFQQALARADVVIASGGLGPTMDDLTRETAAQLTGRSLRFAPAVWERIKGRRRGPIPQNMKRQAMVPEGAQILPNDVGSAPGLAIPTADEQRLLILLPGPPHELEPMFENYVIPLLLRRLGERTTLISRTLRFCGIGESPLEEQLKDLFAAQQDPTLATYAKPGDVHLRISTKATSPEAGLARITTVENEIRARLADFIYGTDTTTLEQAVGRLLQQLNWRIAIVDAVGGGVLATRLVNPADSASWFAGGLTLPPGQINADTDKDWNGRFDAQIVVLLIAGNEQNAQIIVRTQAGQSQQGELKGVSGNETWQWRLSQTALTLLRQLLLATLQKSRD